jgi:NAD(P) transhydrogenase
VLGVYVIGENAAEIVHIGQAVLRLGATIEYFRDAVFNLPDSGGSLQAGGSGRVE